MPISESAKRQSANRPGLDPGAVDQVIRGALAEDLGPGDVTSDGLVPEDARARARLVAKQDGVLAGLGVFTRVFELCDPQARIEVQAADGQSIKAGAELARIEGNARALLLAERCALNLLQRMSGIATRTAGFVALLADVPGVRVLDTRKTTPGLRALEKYAVLCGGGANHRFGLFDQALIKENHLALAGQAVEPAVAQLRGELGPDVLLTCEAQDEHEARAAVRGGADVVMLDNMSAEAMADLAPELRALAQERGRPLELEASGGVTEHNLLAVARSGVDRISVGALTHSVPALDLSLYLEALGPE
jgi:nicotinate-nucleotide pyrophosphorylase (carboxylating)